METRDQTWKSKLGKLTAKDLPVQVFLEIDRAKEKPTLHLEQILLASLIVGSNITGNSRLNNGIYPYP